MEELKHIISGVIKAIPDVRNYKLKVDEDEVFPEEFELKMIRVKNQSNVSSCVAHSLSEVIEYHNVRQNNDDTEMSVGWIYGNRKTSFNKKAGLMIPDAIDAVRKYGDVPKELFPLNEEVPEIIDEFDLSYDTLKDKAMYCRFSGYYGVSTEREIKKSLMKDGPVVFSIKWFNDIKVVNGVLISSCEGKFDGRHCMVIYGWNEKGFKVLNSWGKRWGNSGTVILPYNFAIEEAYGIVDDIMDGRDDIIKPYSSNKFTEFVAKVLNAFAFVFYKIKRFFSK